MADTVRHPDEADNSNSQFPYSSEQLPDEYVSVKKILMFVNWNWCLSNFFQGDDGKIDQDITGNGEMYEIENEDHIAIDRNDGNTEYAGEGYGKLMYIFHWKWKSSSTIIPCLFHCVESLVWFSHNCFKILYFLL